VLQAVHKKEKLQRGKAQNFKSKYRSSRKLELFQYQNQIQETTLTFS